MSYIIDGGAISPPEYRTPCGCELDSDAHALERLLDDMTTAESHGDNFVLELGQLIGKYYDYSGHCADCQKGD